MIKTLEKLEELSEAILSFRQDSRDHCLENLEESTEFTRGVSAGEDRAFHLVLCLFCVILDELEDSV